MKSLGVFLVVAVAVALALPKTESEKGSARKGKVRKAGIVPFIVGDKAENVAVKNSIPYQLSLQVDGEHKCGAVIYNKNWALTAASCVYGISASKITLVAGAHSLAVPADSEKTREAKDIVFHWDYSPYRNNFNIALIQLKTPFVLTGNIKKIELYNKLEGDLQPTDELHVSGWGLTGPTYDSTVLKVQTTTLQAKSECEKIYKPLKKNIFDDVVCCGLVVSGVITQDACVGDYGGPLVLVTNGQPDTLVGIASTGLDCELGVPAPVIYTFVNHADVRQWITETI